MKITFYIPELSCNGGGVDGLLDVMFATSGARSPVCLRSSLFTKCQTLGGKCTAFDDEPMPARLEC